MSTVSEIEDAVVMGKFDLGVLIHENRFTYHQKGLIKVCDLGEIWEERQNAPIPLACIAARKNMTPDFREQISRLIKNSLEYAFAHYPEITDYTRQHAQAMDETVMRQHIQLYVNNFSLDPGPEGDKAIEGLLTVYNRMKQAGPFLTSAV